jgi:hypothetical protein
MPKMRVCPRDGREFETLTDLITHQTLDHDHSKKWLRTVSCRRCAKDIDVNITFTCECGWTLPQEGRSQMSTDRVVIAAWEKMYADWESGTSLSPSTSDLMHAAEEITGKRYAEDAADLVCDVAEGGGTLEEQWQELCRHEMSDIIETEVIELVVTAYEVRCPRPKCGYHRRTNDFHEAHDYRYKHDEGHREVGNDAHVRD